MNYAEMLKSYIKSSGLTLDEISYHLEKRNLSASKQYLSRLQNGKNPPASEELNRAIAEITNGEPEALIMAAFVEKAPPEVKSLLEEGTKQREASLLLRKLNDYLDFYLRFGRVSEDILDSIHEAAQNLKNFDIDFHMLRKDPAGMYRFLVIELTAYLLNSHSEYNEERHTGPRYISDALDDLTKSLETRSARYRAAMEGKLLLDAESDVETKETSMSFFGGPEKYTPDEIAEMEAALERYRAMKRRAAEEAAKENDSKK